MILIFEDNEKSPISGLLHSCIAGEHIIFADGNKSVECEIKEHLNEDVIAFFDVPPNNWSVVSEYYRLVEEFEIYENVWIVPIICIEYSVLQMLIHFGYAQDILLRRIQTGFTKEGYANNLKDMDDGHRKKAVGSLEQYCKQLLITSKIQCLSNKMQDRKGAFYKADCDCVGECPLARKEVRKIKAEQLYVSLPVFYVRDIEHRQILESLGVELGDILSYNEMICKRKNFFDGICEELGFNKLVFTYRDV